MVELAWYISVLAFLVHMVIVVTSFILLIAHYLIND